MENHGLRDRMEADPVLHSNLLRSLLIGRVGRPEEINGMAILLSSDASSFMAGGLVPWTTATSPRTRAARTPACRRSGLRRRTVPCDVAGHRFTVQTPTTVGVETNA